MKCSRCGIDLLEAANFCHSCGIPLKTEVDAVDSDSAARVFKAKDATTLIWQSGKSGVEIIAPGKSASGEEEDHMVHSIEDLVDLIRDKPSSVDEAGYVSGDVIFYIFTAWR